MHSLRKFPLTMTCLLCHFSNVNVFLVGESFKLSTYLEVLNTIQFPPPWIIQGGGKLNDDHHDEWKQFQNLNSVFVQCFLSLTKHKQSFDCSTLGLVLCDIKSIVKKSSSWTTCRKNFKYHISELCYKRRVTIEFTIRGDDLYHLKHFIPSLFMISFSPTTTNMMMELGANDHVY